MADLAVWTGNSNYESTTDVVKRRDGVRNAYLVYLVEKVKIADPKNGRLPYQSFEMETNLFSEADGPEIKRVVEAMVEGYTVSTSFRYDYGCDPVDRIKFTPK